MAIFKINRKTFSYSGATTSRVDNAIPDIDSIDFSSSNKSNFLAEIGLLGLAAFIVGIYKFFKNKKAANKYKASAKEIEAIKAELPEEFEKLRDIQHEVVNQCKFMFASKSSLNFYINILPSLLNLNSEEFIAGWARETGKSKKKVRWAPILSMYEGKYVFLYDFDNKYWFVVYDGKEYAPSKSIWELLCYEFEHAKEVSKEALKDYPEVLRQATIYLDLNIKLIKKELGKIVVKRKSFGIIGSLFGAKNLAAARTGIKTLADGTTKTLGMGGRALEVGKAAAKSVGTVGLGAAGLAGVSAYKAGGGDLISGGERSAKEMENM